MREHSPDLAELTKALVAAQGEFAAIPKTATNPFFKSQYASLPVVVETASPVLVAHGLAVSQFPGTDEHGDTLTTWLLHSSGQFISDTMRLRPVKDDPQSQGSAMTYARRYSYMAVLGLVADEDDDGNAASAGARKASRRQPAATPPPAPHGMVDAGAVRGALLERAKTLGLSTADASSLARKVWGDRPANPVTEAVRDELVLALTDEVAKQ